MLVGRRAAMKGFDAHVIGSIDPRRCSRGEALSCSVLVLRHLRRIGLASSTCGKVGLQYLSTKGRRQAKRP